MFGQVLYPMRAGWDVNIDLLDLCPNYTHDILFAGGAHVIPLSGGKIASVGAPLPLVVNFVTGPKQVRQGVEYFLLLPVCL